MASASLSDRFRRAVQSDDLPSAKRIFERATGQSESSSTSFDIRNQTMMPSHTSASLYASHTHRAAGGAAYHPYSTQHARPFHSEEALGICTALSASQYNTARQSRIRERNREANRAKSSLALAVESGASMEMIQWLLNMGHEQGDFSRDTRGCTAVSLAAQYNRTDVIEACCIDAVAHAATLHHQHSLIYGYPINLNALEDEEDEENVDDDQASGSDGGLSPALTLVTAAASTPSRRPSPSPISLHITDGTSVDHSGQPKNVDGDDKSSAGGSSELDDIVGVTIQRLLDCPDELGRTALALASMKGHEASVRLLIDLGATIDLGDYEGNRPLHYASAYNQLIVVQMLIERGCSFAVKNVLDFTAADYAWNLSLKSALEAFARAQFDVKRIRGRNNAGATSPAPPSTALHAVTHGGSVEHEPGHKPAAFSSTSNAIGLFPATLRPTEASLPPSPHLKLSAQLRDIF